MQKNCVKLRFIKLDDNGYVEDELYDFFIGGSFAAVDGKVLHPLNSDYELDKEYVRNLNVSDEFPAISEYDNKITINSIYDIHSLKQNLECRCSTLRGELPYNTDLGVPIKLLPQETELAIIDLISNTAGVKSCTVINRQFINRKLSLELEIQTIFGELKLNI